MKLNNHIATGNTAEIYLDNSKLIKLYNSGTDIKEAEAESEKQKFAYSLGLPVPKVYEVNTIGERAALIMEYINGSSLGEMALQDISKAPHYLGISVDIQLQLHSKRVTGFIPMKDKLYGNIKNAANLDKTAKKKLLMGLESLSFGDKLCHGDFHLLNLISSDDKTYIIDWIDASAGSPQADAFRTYLLYLEGYPEFAEVYLNIYCQKSGFSKKDIFAFAPFVAGARLSENTKNGNPALLLRLVNNYVKI